MQGMSVLIRGMEMPTCCMFCPISTAAGCGLTNPPVLMTSKEMLQGRPDWCPLFPVPPHGRLGDLDELGKEVNRECDKYDAGITGTLTCLNRILAAFSNAPTIIPAEAGE